jgi:hypothetical protein
MDTTQATYALSLPALDPFGGPHFTADDDDVAGSPWTGDPSSVPLPAVADQGKQLDTAGADMDQAIFAALLTP